MGAEAAEATIAGRDVAWLHAALGEAAEPWVRSILERLDWAAALPNPAAPSFVFLAGACGGEPVGGGGASLAEAAGRLAGETAEVLAQAAPPRTCALPGDATIDALWSDAAHPARVAAADLAQGVPAGVPASAIFPALAAERHADAPPRSLGLAAGPDLDAARLAGLLELVERDAAGRWWTGATAPRALDPAATGALALAPLRAGAETPRATTLLALPAAAHVPVVCALSRDAHGRGLAFGLKAALDVAAAARGAVIELLQMEIALQMAAHRSARGNPTPGDAAALARAALDAEAPAFAARPALPSPPPPADLPALVARLADAGSRVLAADLADPPGGPAVAKVFATGLLPYPGPSLDATPGSPATLAALM